MSFTSRCEIASPNPVPPNCCVVETSAWVNAVKIFSRFSRAMPMPVSDTAKLSLTEELVEESVSEMKDAARRLAA